MAGDSSFSKRKNGVEGKAPAFNATPKEIKKEKQHTSNHVNKRLFCL